MKVTLDQLKSLHKSDAVLYSYVLPACRGVGDVIEIDIPQIKGEAYQKLLQTWAKENNIEEPLSSSHGEFCSCNNCFQKRTREEMAKAEAEKPAKEMLQAAVARLQEYFKAGLVDSPENAAIFDRTWREHPQLSKIRESSPQVVDAVIAVCRQQLKWRSAEPTPASAQEPVVRTLPNGEPELPIDALTTGAYRGASKAQLQDLSRRLGEGQSWLKRGKGVGVFGGNIDTGHQSQVI
jgi:hypothetical protein